MKKNYNINIKPACVTTSLCFIGWFGIRKDFCEFLLGTCTFLQEYGNISCKFSESVFSRPSGDETSIEPQRKPILHEYPAKCVVPVVSIEMPDWRWTCALCIQQLQLSTKTSWCQWTGISKWKGKTSRERRGELRKAVEGWFFALWNKTYLVCLEV